MRLRENSTFHGAGAEKKERRLAESQAPPLQLNQFVPYLTGSPPSRHGCRYRRVVDCAHYKTIDRNSQYRFQQRRYLRCHGTQWQGSGSACPAYLSLLRKRRKNRKNRKRQRFNGRSPCYTERHDVQCASSQCLPLAIQCLNND